MFEHPPTMFCTLVLACLAIAFIGCSGSTYKQVTAPLSSKTHRPVKSGEGSPDSLRYPVTSAGPAAAGKRVIMTAPEYRGTDVSHMLYLPPEWSSDWKAKNRSWPVIVEYTGNHFPTSGSTGKIEDAKLGYGVSGGRCIWVTLPFVSKNETENEVWWWGNVAATVEYAKRNIPRICERYGGDKNNVVLCGFSRGAIAASFIGLHDDEIAKLWCGIITHDHFDGLQEWKNTEWGSPLDQYQTEAAKRISRLGNRPVMVCDGFTTDRYREFLKGKLAPQQVTFVNANVKSILGEFPNPHAKHPHTDAWLALDSRERQQVWSWFETTTRNNAH